MVGYFKDLLVVKLKAPIPWISWYNVSLTRANVAQTSTMSH